MNIKVLFFSLGVLFISVSDVSIASNNTTSDSIEFTYTGNGRSYYGRDVIKYAASLLNGAFVKVVLENNDHVFISKNRRFSSEQRFKASVRKGPLLKVEGFDLPLFFEHNLVKGSQIINACLGRVKKYSRDCVVKINNECIDPSKDYTIDLSCVASIEPRKKNRDSNINIRKREIDEVLDVEQQSFQKKSRLNKRKKDKSVIREEESKKKVHELFARYERRSVQCKQELDNRDNDIVFSDQTNKFELDDRFHLAVYIPEE